MGQQAAIRAIDADIFDAFADAGMGDAATYTAPTIGADPVPCTVLFDHGVQNVGEFGQTIGTRDQVRVQLAEITPARGGIIAIGSASLKLESLIAEDESAQLWVVIRV